MSCYLCLLDLSGTATATLGCCAKVVHTACLVKEVSVRMENDFGFVQCECGVNIWETQNTYHAYPPQEAIEARVATLLAQPEVRQEVKDIKKASTVMTKAHKAFGSFMKGVKAQYKEQTVQHIIALKQIRDATKNSIKQSAEYKAHRRARTAVTALHAKFRVKHNVSSREFRHIVGYARRNMPMWTYRYYTSERMLRRILRILI